MSKAKSERSDLQSAERVRILFVCTANVCRSPMADALMSYEVRKHDLPVAVMSAGLLSGGRSADPRVIKRVKRCGADLDGHVSRALSAELVRGADFILTMTADHVVQLVGRFPDAMPRTHTIRHFVQSARQRRSDETLLEWATAANSHARTNYAFTDASEDIDDPIDLPDAAVESLLVELTSLVGWLRRLIVSPDYRSRSGDETAYVAANAKVVPDPDERRPNTASRHHHRVEGPPTARRPPNTAFTDHSR